MVQANFIANPLTQQYIGWSFAGCIALLAGVNVLNLIVPIIFNQIEKLKNKCCTKPISEEG